MLVYYKLRVYCICTAQHSDMPVYARRAYIYMERNINWHVHHICCMWSYFKIIFIRCVCVCFLCIYLRYVRVSVCMLGLLPGSICLSHAYNIFPFLFFFFLLVFGWLFITFFFAFVPPDLTHFVFYHRILFYIFIWYHNNAYWILKWAWRVKRAKEAKCIRVAVAAVYICVFAFDCNTRDLNRLIKNCRMEITIVMWWTMFESHFFFACFCFFYFALLWFSAPFYAVARVHILRS